MSGTVHIALGIHDPQGDYSRHAGAMLASLFMHAAGPVIAHIVHNDSLTAVNRQRFQQVAERFGKEIRFYPVQLSASVRPLAGHVTEGALFRLLLPELVPVEKIIYFDCDIVVTLDIALLWNVDLAGNPVAAVLDPGVAAFPELVRQRVLSTGVTLQHYFNSGVMLLDLHCLRQNYQLYKQATEYLFRYPQSVFHDQDALNSLFQHNYLQLDSRFNRIVSRTGGAELNQPAIWHFAGVKPWLYYSSPLDMLYWKAVALTPWQNELFDGLAAAFARTIKAIQAPEDSQNPASLRWVTLFPEAENFHLTKDVGMIPFVLHKQAGYDAKLACYKNGEYPYLEKEVKGLKLSFIDHCGKDSMEDGCEYLRQHATEIDILHVFHLSIRTFRWISLYKTLNPQGKVYLKLDADIIVLKLRLTEEIVNILKMCDLISTETRFLYQQLNKIWPVRIVYIPNGFYDFDRRRAIVWAEKEKIICTVGRIGAKEKATEVLLEAFKLAAPLLPEWKLKLIGAIEPQFSVFIQQYIAENPQLVDRIIFTGPITDKGVLEEEYRRAKVFCLTSTFESFGIVLVEAIKNGCFVITSNVGAAFDITDNGKYGSVFSIGNVEQLAKLLVSSCSDPEKLKWVCEQVPDFAYSKFQWDTICKTIAAKVFTRIDTTT